MVRRQTTLNSIRIMKLLLMFIGVSVGFAATELEAQIAHPLPPEETKRIEQEVAQAPIGLVETNLSQEKFFPRKIKIIQELGNRTDPNALALLRRLKTAQLGNSIETQRLRAVTLIAIAKAEAGRDMGRLVKTLE